MKKILITLLMLAAGTCLQAQQKDVFIDDIELGDQVEAPDGTTGSYRNLPRQGKTIEFVFQADKGTVTKKLTWDGSKFVK